MAWFSGGFSQFSNLTDQISSFTKEVLIETTEEVEDPGAELQVAKKKLSDLEKLDEHVQSEYLKVKSHNEELNERVETAECQIATISQEYRKLLLERDEELKRCKMENEKLREEQKHFVHDTTTHSPLNELAGGQFFQNGSVFENVDIGEEGWVDEFHDFSDVVNSQGEINRLQSDLARLKVECQHWKDAAREKVPLSETGFNDSDHEQIKDLQASLQHEVDKHQHELSSLQSIYSERIHSLTERHQHEVLQLQQQISQFNSQSTLVRLSKEEESPKRDEWSARCTELEQEITRLKEKSRTSERLAHKEQSQELDSLKMLNSQLKHDIDLLVTEKANLEMKLAEMVTLLKKENAREIGELDGERRYLQNQLDQLQSTITYHQDIISKLHEEHSHSQTKVKQLQTNIESLEEQVKEKENEILSLRSSGENMVRLQRELEEKSSLLEANGQTLQELGQLLESKESKVELLKNQIRDLQDNELAKMAELESKFVQEREILLQNLAELKEQVKHTSTEQSAASRESERIVKLQADLASIATEKEELTKQLSSKEKVINDLSISLQKVIQERGDLSKHNMLVEQDRLQSNQLQIELNSLREGKTTLARELQGKQDECAKYLKQLGQLRAHLLEVEETYTQEALKADEREAALKDELSELKENLHQSKANQDAVQSRYTQDQLSRIQDDLQAMVDQRDDALLQMANAQEQAHQNAIALRNLQSVLEQFQRDQSSELAQALKRSQTELADARHECQSLRTEHAQTETKLLEASQLMDEVVCLKQELSEKEIEEICAELEELNHSLEERKTGIEKLSGEDSERVDRNLVKNLVLGYVHAIDAKKPEVLKLVSKILGFSEEELAQALGEGRGRGWLRGLWGRTSQVDTQESLSQLFVKFLQSESLPQTATPHVTTPSLIPGYVDSRTDPDRPSLATAAVLGSQLLTHHHASHSLSNQLLEQSQGKDIVADQISLSKKSLPQSHGSFQSALLNS